MLTTVVTVAALIAGMQSASFAATKPSSLATFVPPPVYLGAVGEVSALTRSIGAPLGTHAFAHFNDSVPYGRMISVETTVSWARLAASGPGSTVYDDIVRWARTLKTRPGPIFLAFSGEPESSGSDGLGTATDFKNAWRRVVTIFRAQGVSNVVYTWQMTAWSFRTSPSDPRYAAKWYPGDSYVDNVGGDAYNWYTCGSGQGRWMELSTMAKPVVAFAVAHGKKASLPEFASFTNSRRAQWLDNAHQYLAANRGVIRAAYYYQRAPTNAKNDDCRWKLTTSAEFAAYGRLARDSAFTP